MTEEAFGGAANNDPKLDDAIRRIQAESGGQSAWN
jgi:hypothetical protein